MKPIISRITDEWIAKHQPCQSAIDWWDKKERNPVKILKLLIKTKKYDWANWFIVRVMEYRDYVAYAVYAAECVLDIYEKNYPDEKRPREAIKAAKRCIKDPCEDNKMIAGAAAEAARAAEAAAWAAAWAAEAAAWAAAEAASAAKAARAAGAAAEAAEAAGADIHLKILKYGMKLLGVR